QSVFISPHRPRFAPDTLRLFLPVTSQLPPPLPFVYLRVHHRELLSFPTRRSSDLSANVFVADASPKLLLALIATVPPLIAVAPGSELVPPSIQVRFHVVVSADPDTTPLSVRLSLLLSTCTIAPAPPSATVPVHVLL